MNLLEVSNMALDLLTQKRILTLESEDRVPQLCKTWANIVFESSLRMYRPNFATKEATLQYNLTKQGFQLPADYVMILSCSAETYDLRGSALVVGDAEGGTTIDIEYISNKDELLQYAAAQFLEAMAYTLASKLAVPLTKEPSIATAMAGQAKTTWSSYSFADNQERRPSRVAEGLNRTTSTWTRNRGTLYGRKHV